MTSQYEIAKEQAAKFGFLVTENTEYDIDTGEPVLCVRIDRIGPPAMYQHWQPSPFNDHLLFGAWPHLIEWVSRLQAHAALQ